MVWFTPGRRSNAPVIKVALPVAGSRLTSTVVDPNVNRTTPGGVPLPGGLTDTCAVKVTGWPNADGLSDWVSVVVVAAPFTVWVNEARVGLAAKFPEPAYSTVIVWGPMANWVLVVVNVA